MKTIYVANDGEQFENKKDCLDYEKRIEENYNLTEAILFTRTGEVLKTRNRAECYSACSNAHYMFVKSEKDYDKIKAIFKEAGYSDIFPEYNKKYEEEGNIFAYEYANKDFEWVELHSLFQKVIEDIAKIKFLFDTAK